MLRTLRCLVNRLDRVQRENADLRKRLSEVEALLGELPSTFANIDGVITREEGRAIGRASFILSARSTGGANALPLDQDVLEELCARDGGCALSVGFRSISLFGNELRAAEISGPCQFAYDAESGDWTIGQGCEGGAATGTDGGSRAGADPVEGAVVATSREACLFTESAPARSVGSDGVFESDHARGMFLVAIPERQPNGISRFQCELLLQ